MAASVSTGDIQYWYHPKQDLAQFLAQRDWTLSALETLDAHTRAGVLEAVQVFGMGVGQRALAHATGDASMHDVQTQARAMALHLAAGGPPDHDITPQRALGRPEDVGPETTWWEGQRHEAYEFGRRWVARDLAALDPPARAALVHRIRTHSGPANSFLEGERELREQSAESAGRHGVALMEQVHQGRLQGLRDWLAHIPPDQQGPTMHAALAGQAEPGARWPAHSEPSGNEHGQVRPGPTTNRPPGFGRS